MKDQISVTEVPFYGETIPTIIRDGKQYVAMKPISESLGLRWGSQYNRLMRDDVLKSVVFIMKMTAKDGKSYDSVFIPSSMLNGWLFGVAVKRVLPELREKLTQYKRECYEVLHDHFVGQQQSVMQAMNSVLYEYKVQESIASQSGRNLNRWKKIKPSLLTTMERLQDESQLKLIA